MVSPSDKAILFYSAPKVSHIELFRKNKINSILLSYELVKNKENDFIKLAEYIKEMKGYLMLDSGAFTFKTKKAQLEGRTIEDYVEHTEALVAFIEKYRNYIYCAANMDMDRWVGEELVDKWNEKYFKPLEKITNIIYNIDPDRSRDVTGMKRAETYFRRYGYVGIGIGMIPQLPKIMYLQNKYKRRVHGFAITRLKLLKSYPLFSVDSTTWLRAEIFGSVNSFDGKNFRTAGTDQRYKRKLFKVQALEQGIDWEAMVAGKAKDLTEWNTYAWTGFEREYLNYAKTKLRTLNVGYYDKRPKSSA